MVRFPVGDRPQPFHLFRQGLLILLVVNPQPGLLPLMLESGGWGTDRSIDVRGTALLLPHAPWPGPGLGLHLRPRSLLWTRIKPETVPSEGSGSNTEHRPDRSLFLEETELLSQGHLDPTGSSHSVDTWRVCPRPQCEAPQRLLPRGVRAETEPQAGAWPPGPTGHLGCWARGCSDHPGASSLSPAPKAAPLPRQSPAGLQLVCVCCGLEGGTPW